jgi:pimeloyl-ACP methyl ester carboxylesterase
VSRRFRLPGLVLTEHEFQVPLVHGEPGDRRHITVFAREAASPDGLDKPYLVFFQGGPGHESPRPLSRSGWVGHMVEKFRVLLLDQRGTGRSSPITRQTLAGMPPAEQAEYLTHFRADSIVADAEFIRGALGVEKWSVLGQSFGGFCVTTYLSFHPQALKEALITGGTPPLHGGPDLVYRHTYPRVRERVKQFYAAYPGDREIVRRVMERLQGGDVRLPGGDVLTPQRFRQVGAELGFTDTFHGLHYLLERAFAGDELSEVFLQEVEHSTAYLGRPIYALLHEACYADGPGATDWSAQRVLAEFPEFADDPTLLTGEMIYPATFEDSGLAPLREAGEILAAKQDWPRLYDREQLARNEVPVAAVAYVEDLFVDYELSRETAGLMPNFRLWATNEYEHNGLRADGERILGRLLDLARGMV